MKSQYKVTYIRKGNKQPDEAPAVVTTDSFNHAADIIHGRGHIPIKVEYISQAGSGGFDFTPRYKEETPL